MLSWGKTVATRCIKASKASLSVRPTRPVKLNKLASIKSTRSPLSLRASLSLSRRFYSTSGSSEVIQPVAEMVQETSGVQTRDVILPDGGTMDPTAWQAIIEANTALVDEVMIPVTPETLAVHMWLMLQHDLGIPLWLAMALTTWGLRTVGLPLFFAQVRNMATMSFIAPKIQELKNKIEEQKHRGDDVMVKVWEDKLGALYKAFDVVPWKNFSNSLAVIPLMVAQAISARYMLGHTPHLLEDAGPLWLSNLNEVDPYYITPAIYVALQLLILRLNLPMQSGITGPLKLKTGSWILLTAYSGFLAFICTSFPAAISTIWLYSMSFTAASNAMAYLPSVRRRLGIATSLPTERPSHLPPAAENPVKSLVHKELLRSRKSG